MVSEIRLVAKEDEAVFGRRSFMNWKEDLLELIKMEQVSRHVDNQLFMRAASERGAHAPVLFAITL